MGPKFSCKLPLRSVQTKWKVRTFISLHKGLSSGGEVKHSFSFLAAHSYSDVPDNSNWIMSTQKL